MRRKIEILMDLSKGHRFRRPTAVQIEAAIVAVLTIAALVASIAHYLP